MAYGTVNADVIGTSVAGSNLGAGNASTMKNRIINGAMVIDQRNAGASVATTTGQLYTLDRWQTVVTLNSTFSVQQNAGSVTPPAGFTNYLGVTSTATTSPTGNDLYLVKQAIEGYNIADLAWGTASAKAITLSFWVRSSLTGTFGGSLQNAQTLSYPFTYSIPVANTWTQISITVPGPTTGTWNTTNSQGMWVWLSMGCGTTYSGTATGAWQAGDYRSATGSVNVVGTNGATFYITGVQLEVGSSATGFEYRQYTTELNLCQRYFETVGCGGVGIARGGTTPGATMSFKFQTSKRIANPTISINAATLIYAPATASYSATSWSGTNYSSNAGVTGDINTATTTATLGTSVQWYGNDNVWISAEL